MTDNEREWPKQNVYDHALQPQLCAATHDQDWLNMIKLSKTQYRMIDSIQKIPTDIRQARYGEHDACDAHDWA
jgi:hypothetical protein